MVSIGNSLTKGTSEKNKVNGCLVTEGGTTSEDRSIREPQIRNAELAGKTHHGVHQYPLPPMYCASWVQA